MHYLVWDIDPVLIHWGPLQIRWYGLMFAGAFMTGYSLMYWIYQREGRNVEQLDTLLWYVAIGTVGGARLGHCLLYDPAYYLNNPFKILAIWEGGLASHGATIGIFVALLLYCMKTKDSLVSLMDKVAFSCLLGGSLVRIGNFFNSEILGHPADVPWAVIFAKIDFVPRHPVQLYEAFSYILIFLVLLHAYKKTAEKKIEGFIFGLFTSLVFSARFLLEFFKTRQAAYSLDIGLSTGQLLSIPFVLVGISFIVWSLHQYRKHSAQ